MSSAVYLRIEEGYACLIHCLYILCVALTVAAQYIVSSRVHARRPFGNGTSICYVRTSVVYREP